MAYIYLREFGSKQLAFPKIKDGIIRYNLANAKFVEHGYNETITTFFVHVMELAMNNTNLDAKSEDDCSAATTCDEEFIEFLETFPMLQDKILLQTYYSSEILSSDLAKRQFVTPNKKPMPMHIKDLFV